MLSEKTQSVSTSGSHILQNVIDKNIMDYQKSMLDLITNLHRVQILVQMNNLQEEYDPEEDFKWFTSGEVDTISFKGKYIAIWKKQIVGSGESAVEVERLAKAYCGENCTPAIVYIPEKEDAIL